VKIYQAYQDDSGTACLGVENNSGTCVLVTVIRNKFEMNYDSGHCNLVYMELADRDTASLFATDMIMFLIG